MEKVNYLGMRKIFERTGKQEELERLILNYLNNEKVQSDVKDPVLYDVVLRESVINGLSVNEVKMLLLNGAKPTQVLIERLLKRQSYDVLFFLYEHEYIGVEDLQKRIFEICGDSSFGDFCSMCEAIIGNTRKFVGFDFRELEKVFNIRMTFVTDTGFIWSKILSLCFHFMRSLPDDNHLPVINTFHNCIRSKRADFSETLCLDLKKQMCDFMQGEIFSKLSGNDLVEALNVPKYKAILLDNPLIPFKSFFQKDSGNNYIPIMTEIFESMCDGKIDRISVAFRYFPELFGKRIEILNAWVKRDKILEIDIYGNAIIEAEKGIFEEKINSNLDEKYSAIKNDEHTVGDKKLDFGQVGSQNSIKP